MPSLRSARSDRIANPKSRKLAGFLLATLGGVFAACTEQIPPTPIASIRIQPLLDSFYVGRSTTTVPFTVTLLNAQNGEISGRPVTYSSSSPDLFSVDANTGVLTGKATGSGFFRATVEGRFVEAGVRIIQAVDRIQLNTSDFQLTVGGTRQVVPVLIAADGQTISGRAVTFSSSSPQTVSVSVGGLVTAVSQGVSIITVASEGKSATVTVTVTRDPVSAIRVSPSFTQLLRVGGSLQFVAVVTSATGNVLTDRTVTWFSNNPQVLSVSANGFVTAIAPGTAQLTAECEGRSASVPLTVTLVPIGSVTLSPSVDTLMENDVRQYNPVAVDSAGRILTSLAGRQVTFQSNNLPIATVQPNTGVVAGVSQGTAQIVATIDGVSSNALTIVVARLSEVVVSPASDTLAVGETLQLSVQLKDASGNILRTSRPTVFASSAQPVATVTQSGFVTAVGKGIALIGVVVNGLAGTSIITVP